MALMDEFNEEPQTREQADEAARLAFVALYKAQHMARQEWQVPEACVAENPYLAPGQPPNTERPWQSEQDQYELACMLLSNPDLRESGEAALRRLNIDPNIIHRYKAA